MILLQKVTETELNFVPSVGFLRGLDVRESDGNVKILKFCFVNLAQSMTIIPHSAKLSQNEIFLSLNFISIDPNKNIEEQNT